jgi:hypothetical protein
MTAAKYAATLATVQGLGNRDQTVCATDFHAAIGSLVVEQASDIVALIAAVQALTSPTPAANSAHSVVNVSAAAPALALAANPLRKSAKIYNNSSGKVYVGELVAASLSATNFTHIIQPDESYDVTAYTGVLSILGAKTNGNVQVTERT